MRDEDIRDKVGVAAGEQDVGDAEMVQACEEEIHIPVQRCQRLAMMISGEAEVGQKSYGER